MVIKLKSKKGFTLIETIIALSIVALILPIISSILFGTLLNMNTTTREQNGLVDFNTFKKQLIDDASRGTSMEIDNNMLKIYMDSVTIEYKFITSGSNTIVKRNTVECFSNITSYNITSSSSNSAVLELVINKKTKTINLENDIKFLEFDSR